MGNLQITGKAQWLTPTKAPATLAAMKATPEGNIILIENPLTGNCALIDGLSLSAGQNKWTLPKDARVEVGKEAWTSATKIVLVREPVERLISGVALALRREPECLTNNGASPEFLSLIDAGKPLNDSASFTLFLDYLEASGFSGAPTWLQPQSLWLSAKFDFVIATHNIAEFFNATRMGKSIVRKHFLATCSAHPYAPRITPELRQRALAIYAEDADKFNRLLVWSPEAGGVRLISGYCAACQAKRGTDFIPLELTDPVEESAPAAPSKKK